MTPDFAPLPVHLAERFASIQRGVTELKDAFASLQGAVDANAKRADAHF